MSAAAATTAVDAAWRVNISILCMRDAELIYSTEMERASAMVSIRDPVCSTVYCEARDIIQSCRMKQIDLLTLEMRDANDDCMKEDEAPTLADIHTLVKFAAIIVTKQHRNILLHCQSYIGRCTAAAYILLREFGYTTTEAVESVTTAWPGCTAHKLMLRLYHALTSSSPVASLTLPFEAQTELAALAMDDKTSKATSVSCDDVTNESITRHWKWSAWYTSEVMQRLQR
jgi:predicted protein tyrosine phosphatase